MALRRIQNNICRGIINIKDIRIVLLIEGINTYQTAYNFSVRICAKSFK